MVTLLTPNLANTVTPCSGSSRSTDSDESWEVATSWLAECINTHLKCRSSSEARRLPTRLLDVGEHGSLTVCLHLTDGTPSTVLYVILSHCWGGINIQKLENETLSPMLKGISISTLPQTFQDAITITRRLGLRYLWIDSLCIIQDSTEDWARESSMMGLVY